MKSAGLVWSLVLFAALAANLPFFTQRLLGFIPMRSAKSLGVRMLEVVVFYLVVGAVGVALEARTGQVASQTWEFFAITAFAFLTLAFPGFVYRYLLLKRV